VAKFPVDAPKSRVIKALALLGFVIVREREHIAMVRNNPDGTQTPLTMPNHGRLKSSTTDERLNALIAVVERYISNKGQNGSPQT
jgi:hypothetical protein